MPGTKKEQKRKRRRLPRTQSGALAGPVNNRRGGNPDLLKTLRQTEVFRCLPRAIKIDELEQGEGAFFHPKPRSFFTCLNCNEEVDCLPYEAKERAVCSVECWKEHVRKRGQRRPDGTGWTTSKRKRFKKYVVPIQYRLARWLREMREPNLTPAQAARLRGQIAVGMSDMIDAAQDVVFGLKTWSPTQARVFGLLLGKVLPDLSASHVISERRNATPSEMTMEELEALLAEQRALADESDSVIIDLDAQESPDAPPLQD